MRIINSGNDENLIEFDNWLKNVGDGKLPNYPGTDLITLPEELCSEIIAEEELKCQDEAIKFAFGDIEYKSVPG